MRCLCSMALLLGLAAAGTAAEPVFPLRDGDLWVMAGDSITAQHLHSNYFEAFCFARYPKAKFAFRNSGVGGHTVPSTLARFEYDVAAWKPTIVSVELGMNDAGNTAPDAFIKSMGAMVERIRKAEARPVVLSASPVNDGLPLARAGTRNQRLAEYADGLKEFCEKERVPYADQFHALVDVWARNKPREKLLTAVADLKPAAADDSVAGVEHLRAFLAAQEKDPAAGANLLGDPVHPGAPGQLMMAAALLKQLGADGFVSSAAIDAGADRVEAKGCLISSLKAADGGVSFDRLDECLPFPIADDARPAIAIAQDVLALSQYTLKVTGLKDGDYALKVGGVPSGRFTAKQLAEGLNLTTVTGEGKKANPITAQMRAVLDAVDDKEKLVSQWRMNSQKAHNNKNDKKAREALVTLGARIEDADAKIRDAAKPQTIHFEIVPVAGK
ncbi:GDSL-type esterase/lipase family protein [Gemmata sp.]|uniref:GDSL-type esterase/lipase family protein n=1 Tax=Gemmata sp. TaxID=1914242 RepID=UPI003F70ABBC